MTKRCPHCYRSYSDININFCMEDGSVLTDSFDVPVVTEGHEIETLVRHGNEQVAFSKPEDDWLENWQPAKTSRTQSEHPISSSPKTTVKPFAEWTSSDFLREITYLITHYHTFHAQECLELLRRFLNRYIGNEASRFTNTTWQNGKGHFYSKGGVLTYDFTRDAEPSARDFLLRLLEFETTDRRQKQSASATRRSVSKQEKPGLEYIRFAVAKHSNLELIVHQGSNHRIMKEGHVGSIWIVPRFGGVSITATGQSAPRLYREMERLFGSPHKVDQKGYRYFQADRPDDVIRFVEIWSHV